MDVVVRRLMLRGFALALLALGVAGCDKCGNPVKFKTPSIPNACTADATAQ